MSNLSPLRPALAEALSVILPTPAETLLLRACLSSGDSARRAWEQWQNEFSDGFLGDNESVRKLRPLVFNAQNVHGLEIDKESQTYLRSAYLQEDLRSKIVRRICRDILMLLEKEGIPTIVLKGTALAETVYGNPVLRHCHDIDLLIRDQDMSRAMSLLLSIEFKEIDSKGKPGSNDCQLEHESGLPLELHTALFKLPYYNELLGETWKRSRNQVIADVQTKILAPADNLLHVCGHAFHESRRGSLRWVSDAWFIIDRHRDLDWDLLLDCGVRSHLALPLFVTLAYLAEELSAPIPSNFLDRLLAAASKSSATERELALFGARSAPQGSLVALYRRMRDWRGRAFMIQWLLLPTPTYLFMVEEARPSWPLPFHYIYRPLRYARYLIYSKFVGVLRRIKWRVDRLFLRINFRTP
jgi:putative nucleotidyltransferase-like protein